MYCVLYWAVLYCNVYPQNCTIYIYVLKPPVLYCFPPLYCTVYLPEKCCPVTPHVLQRSRSQCWHTPIHTLNLNLQYFFSLYRVDQNIYTSFLYTGWTKIYKRLFFIQGGPKYIYFFSLHRVDQHIYTSFLYTGWTKIYKLLFFVQCGWKYTYFPLHWLSQKTNFLTQCVPEQT